MTTNDRHYEICQDGLFILVRSHLYIWFIPSFMRLLMSARMESDGSASVTEFTAGTYFSRIRDTPFATRHHESVPLCENTYRTVAKILDDLLCLYLNYDYYFLLLRAWDDSLDFRVGTIGDIYNTYITKYCIGIMRIVMPVFIVRPCI